MMFSFNVNLIILCFVLSCAAEDPCRIFTRPPYYEAHRNYSYRREACILDSELSGDKTLKKICATIPVQVSNLTEVEYLDEWDAWKNKTMATGGDEVQNLINQMQVYTDARAIVHLYENKKLLRTSMKKIKGVRVHCNATEDMLRKFTSIREKQIPEGSLFTTELVFETSWNASVTEFVNAASEDSREAAFCLGSSILPVCNRFGVYTGVISRAKNHPLEDTKRHRHVSPKESQVTVNE